MEIRDKKSKCPFQYAHKTFSHRVGYSKSTAQKGFWQQREGSDSKAFQRQLREGLV